MNSSWLWRHLLLLLLQLAEITPGGGRRQEVIVGDQAALEEPRSMGDELKPALAEGWACSGGIRLWLVLLVL